MCLVTTYSCSFCQRTSTRPPALCDDAGRWGLAYGPEEHVYKIVKTTCSVKCSEKELEVKEWGREKEREVKEWGRGKSERDEAARKERYKDGAREMEGPGEERRMMRAEEGREEL